MKALKWLTILLATYALIVGGAGHKLRGYDDAASSTPTLARLDANAAPLSTLVPATRFQLDSSRSKFIAHALAGGLFWFKGHDHLVAVRDFSGEATLDSDVLANSSLQITAKAASMEETSSVFTEAQKKIINNELREIVLLPNRYPDIIFKSTSVSGKATSANQYDLKIAGNLTLNGVTRPITIPTKITVNGNDLRALGEFSIDRSDFNVKATSAFHGLVRVRDRVKFEFDIAGRGL